MKVNGMGVPADEAGLEVARRRMVEEQLAARGIRDARVLEAMASVPRQRFVDPALRARAYGDHALPTAEGQTISQPYIVARMLELARLEREHRVLEIGTGSGYQTALLARLVQRVFSVERVSSLLRDARRRLDELGISATSRCGTATAASGGRSSHPMIGCSSPLRHPVFPTLSKPSWESGVFS